MTTTLLQGDCRELLPTLPAASVQTVVTSPPYFGLRDYGTAQWNGGDPECVHTSIRRNHTPNEKQSTQHGSSRDRITNTCRSCGARRLDQQLGLEATPDEYVQALVGVFRLVWRVLRDDGTVWLNLGDSYNSATHWSGGGPNAQCGNTRTVANGSTRPILPGLKPKDLIGIPWMVAFALRADGWYLRSDIIWAKPNPMPESVTDRPTKAHEYIFLLSKSERYYYDADAIREPPSPTTHGNRRIFRGGGSYTNNNSFHNDQLQPNKVPGNSAEPVVSRNRRSVWTVATQPYKQAHFATFPEKLIEPCILAGSAARACEVCGAPWERVREPTGHVNKREPAHVPGNTATKIDSTGWAPTSRTTGDWQPTCACPNEGAAHSIVLDPFAGSGTTLRVSERLCRDSIGIDLGYTELQGQRTNGVQKMMVDLL